MRKKMMFLALALATVAGALSAPGAQATGNHACQLCSGSGATLCCRSCVCNSSGIPIACTNVVCNPQ